MHVQIDIVSFDNYEFVKKKQIPESNKLLRDYYYIYHLINFTNIELFYFIIIQLNYYI